MCANCLKHATCDCNAPRRSCSALCICRDLQPQVTQAFVCPNSHSGRAAQQRSCGNYVAMAPPLALAAKHFLPVGCRSCQPSIQDYAADRRAPHPVALLVKQIRVFWDGDCDQEWFVLDNSRAGGSAYFSYTVDERDGEFTTESMQHLERNNRSLKRISQCIADSRNSRNVRPNIHPFFRQMLQEMEDSQYLAGSVSSVPRRGFLAPRPCYSKTWSARGWNGSKRTCTGPYTYVSVILASDSE